MMRIASTTLLLFLSCVIYGQSNIRESVFTHLSGNDFIVGETIFFSPYVYSEQTGKWSDLSKLLYVELLKSSGESVYQTKILLEGGRGEGEYFIPTDLETGTYHLVAYTRWMKNFESFSEQSIRIINPYLAQKFPKAPETKFSVSFSVEGGKMLQDKKNRVVLRVADQYGTGISVKGKITSKSDGEAIEVLTDRFGFFGFDFTPSPNSNYHFILESEDKFEFFDLPMAVNEGLSLKVIDTGGAFVYKIIGASADNYTQGELSISGKNEKDVVQVMAANTAFSIQKRSLPEGLIYASFSIDNVIETDRIIWNGAWPNTSSKYLGSFDTLSRIGVIFEIPDSCILSVAIEMVNEKNTVESFRTNMEWKSQLSIWLPNEFYNAASRTQLDDMLIANSRLVKKENLDNVKYLPEYRSGLVQGSVFDSLNQRVPDEPITLAVSGANRQLGSTRTNESGNFVIPYDPKSQLDMATIQTFGEKSNITIDIEPEFYPKFSPFKDRPIIFDSLLVSESIKRSIQNQIYNAYSDTLEAISWPSQPEQFYGIKSYRLDDFTRFTTIRDTFIELIAEVGVSKKEDNYEFKMRTQESSKKLFVESPTLLLLDGGFVEAEDLMKLSPYVVDRIEVLNRTYYFGNTIFDGIVSVVTFKGDRGEIEPQGKKVNFSPVQVTNASKQRFNTNSQGKRKPDFQDLLLWNSGIQHAGGNFEINSRTSEVTGLFEIRVEGLTTEGKPISRMAYFHVK
ncbi:MAG: hypothetical protein ABJH98_05845 [Reichenbachiella sp.]|uniref:hypothetical protein n=1 Tax=Reichenbachiella sp. TaxID=2184521 RepID=UPI003298BE8D